MLGPGEVAEAHIEELTETIHFFIELFAQMGHGQIEADEAMVSLNKRLTKTTNTIKEIYELQRPQKYGYRHSN